MKPKEHFLQITFNLLAQGQENFRWSEDGGCFGIASVQRFCEDVLPRYFKHCNFASFVRQLNLHNFRKVRVSGFQAAFSHPSFRRDRPNWLCRISRKPRSAKTLSAAVCGLSLGERSSMDSSLEHLLEIQKDLEERTDYLSLRAMETLSNSRQWVAGWDLHSEASHSIDRLLGWLTPALTALPTPLMLPASDSSG